MTADDPISPALRLAAALERLGIDYWIGGSLASTLHGEPRASEDVDFVACLEEQHVDRLAALIEPDFYVDAEYVRDAVRRKTSFNVLDKASLWKIDVFVAGSSPHAREASRRRQSLVVATDPERRLFVTSAEDIVLQKLAWYRQGGGVSDRQWRDVLGVLKVQRQRLDRAPPQGELEFGI